MIRHFLAPCVAFAALAGAAHADSAPDALLQTAIDEAIDASQTRYAFVMSVTERRNDKPATKYHLRYDPRRAESPWTIDEATAESALERAEEVVESMSADAGDDQLLYDKLLDTITDLRLSEDDDAKAIYTASVNDKSVPTDAVEMRLTYEKPGGFISKIDVNSLKPFKPNPAVKVKALSQIQTYEPLVAGGPAFLKRSQNLTKANALFKKYDVEVTTEYSEIVSVSMPSDSN